VVYSGTSNPASQNSNTIELQFYTIPESACRQIFAALIPMAAQIGMTYIYESGTWVSTASNPDATQITCLNGNMSTNFSLK
jgi:hypothetical protein